MPSLFSTYFISMQLSIQFAASCSCPLYEPFMPHKESAPPSLRTPALKNAPITTHL